MRMYDIIDKKKKGGELTESEIRFFVDGYTCGDIPDYQASALMMAIYFNGMTDTEITVLTDAMANSGDTVDLSQFGTLSTDKHSTGGVGDKTSLIVAPIVAACGGKVTKMSGRGLGHTGGTVDKLESIKGYRTTLSPDEFTEQVERVGMAIIGQSGNLTPADKKLYALRDVTATVDSIPLIASSIMSKKLAAGSHNIVLDVKVGSGAFMKTVADAEALAQKMVGIGKLCGRNCAALITDMDSPLGNAIGNSLEIIEAVEVLKGEKRGDLREICVALSANMIRLAFDIDIAEAEKRVEAAIESGAAFKKMKEWISAQGGDISYIDDTSRFPKSQYSAEVISESDGFINYMDAESFGIISAQLGAGRVSKDDTIDHTAGILIAKKIGDKVQKGDVLATLYSNNKADIDGAKAQYLNAVKIGEKAQEKPLIYKVIV